VADGAGNNEAWWGWWGTRAKPGEHKRVYETKSDKSERHEKAPAREADEDHGERTLSGDHGTGSAAVGGSSREDGRMLQHPPVSDLRTSA
jgi:hypothetical protein